MAEIECTAAARDWDDPRQLLFEPDCDCPRCAPPIPDPVVDDRRWLRMSGTTLRFRVEDVTLGGRGRDRLG